MSGVVNTVEDFFNSSFGKLSDPFGKIEFSPINALFGKSSRTGPGVGGFQGTRDVNQSITSTVAPANIVYGTCRVGGVFSFYGLSGANNEYHWYVLAVACHQVNAISNLVIDGNFIPDADFTGSDVTVGKYSGLVSRWVHLGTSTQAADTNLTGTFGAFVPPYTAAFNGYDVAYIVVRFKRDDTAFTQVPQNIQCDVQGKQVYDPRLDSTVSGGSGAQRNNNRATWTYSNNAILCIRDYLSDALNYGCAGWPASVFNDPAIIVQANIADQSIGYTVSGVTLNQSQYTIDGFLTTDQTYGDNLALMLNCINGTLDAVNGTYTPVCGQYNSPSFNIDESWFIAPAKCQLGAKGRDQYNSVRGKYYDNQQNYQQLDYYPFTNAAYIAADGIQKWKDLDLSLCTDLYRAQRLATLVGRQSRNQQVVNLSLDPRGIQLALGDAFNLTIANLFTSKVFVVQSISIQYGPSGLSAQIDAIEDSAAAHTWNAGDAFTVSVPTNPSIVTDTPKSPSSLVATSVADGIQLTWVPPSDGIYYYIEVWRSSTSAFAGASIIGRVYGDTWLDSNITGTQYWYWIRAVSLYRTYSSYTPSTSGAGASAAAYATSFSAVTGSQRNMIPDSGFKAVNIYWPDASGGAIAKVSGGYDGQANAFQYIGTGLPSGYLYRKSLVIPITQGTYTLSGKFYCPNITAGQALIGVYNTAVSVSYGTLSTSATGRQSTQIVIPAGVTSVVVIIDTNNCTVSNGHGLYWQQLQLEPGTVMTGWRECTADDTSGSLLVDAANPSHLNAWDIDSRVNDGANYLRWKSSQQKALISQGTSENQLLDPSFTSSDFWSGGTPNGAGALNSNALGINQTVTSNALDGRGNIQKFLVQPGDSLFAELTLTSFSGTGKGSFSLYVYDASGTQLQNLGPPYETVAGTYSITGVAAAGADHCAFQVQFNGGAAGGGVYAVSPIVKVGAQTLTIPQGAQLGNQTNNIALVGGGWASASWSGITITPHPTSLNVSAGTLKIGGASISYGSSSVSGLANSTTYSLYYKDKPYAGGSQTLYSTSSHNAILTQDDGVIYICDATTQSAGGTGGGGGAGGCVSKAMFLNPRLRAAAAHVGDWLDGASNYKKDGRVRVTHVNIWCEPCVNLVTADGCECELSCDTPMELSDGTTTTASQMLGKMVLTDFGESMVMQVIDVGTKAVMKISREGAASFAAGKDGSKRIWGHNNQKP